ncbi:xin actin-binding repeat-containing protein 1-like [Diretmus argenteus]
MEWKSNLRRTQSLRSVPSSCDKPIWTEAGLRDRKASVSQLVARYQTTVEVRTSIEVTSTNDAEPKLKPVQQEITLPSTTTVTSPRVSSPLGGKPENKQERSNEKERSLIRSKSTGSLENSTGSIRALKALFESKADTSPHRVKSSFRATSYTPLLKAADVLPVNGEVEERNPPAEEQKDAIPAAAAAVAPDHDAKEDEVTLKAVNQSRIMRRKTISGIDFERITAPRADDKRRSIADFRDSSLTQTKEKVVSVKAMSALYLSKVAPAGPTGGLSKPMAEDSDLLAPTSARGQPGTGDIFGAHPRPSMPSQPSKEMLYQQRQKCELRRLLKHTHPELKMLDGVVDEELADVLSSDGGPTAAETGYEGEVLSRRWIFENGADPHALKMQRGDVDRTSALFEQPWERLHEESVKGNTDAGEKPNSTPDPNGECEEEMVRVDVQSTRKMFESQSVDTSRSTPDNKFQGKVVISEDETGAVQKHKQGFEICSKQNLHSNVCIRRLDPSTGNELNENQQYRKWVFENQSTSPPNSESCGEIIETTASLVRNNPFISANIAKEQSLVLRANPQCNTPPSADPAGGSGAAEDILTANVKNRAHLFESMPFDKIRHQNKEDMETMVESINETLSSLYRFSAIHSDGSIIEVNETTMAKKAKYFLSQSGPKINYDEVAEGGTQNFLLQLLPRANLKPQVVYLKEDNQGNVEATVVNVPAHQHQSTNQDAEFKTANVVQLVEDILNQDNSLRKGVIIQQDVNRCAEVVVYSLYKYAEGDVKSYCPPQSRGAEPDDAEYSTGDVNTMGNQDVRKGDVKSTINYLLTTSQDQTCPGYIRPDVTLKGNVQLFKSCIEKGDYEYLKTLQAEQELSPDNTQTVAGGSVETQSNPADPQEEESTSEWAPVDVKRLKNMFSADQNYVQPKQMIHGDLAPSVKTSPSLTCQSTTRGTRESSTECDRVFPHEQGQNNFIECEEKTCDFNIAPQGSRDEHRVHQAELVEVVDDKDDAIDHLQQQLTSQGLSQEHMASRVVSDVKTVNNPKAEARLPQENHKALEYKSESQQENETRHVDDDSEEKQTTEACVHKQDSVAATMPSQGSATELQHEDQEAVVQGRLQAALDSLERSNINVSRGDFRAAMIYRNSSKAHEERCQTVEAVSVQEPTEREICPLPEEGQVATEELSAASAEPTRPGQTPDEPASKSRRPVGPKPDEPATGRSRRPVGPKPDEPATGRSRRPVGPKPDEPASKSRRPVGPKPDEPATGRSRRPVGPKPDEPATGKSRRPVGPKPAIPAKPEHLKVKRTDDQSANAENLKTTQTTTTTTEPKKQSKNEKPLQPLPTTSIMSYKDALKKGLSGTESTAESGSHLLVPDKSERNQPVGEAFQTARETQVNHQAQGSNVTREMNATAQEKRPQNPPVTGDGNETDESHVDFHGACRKFGGKKELSVKSAPVKPKRVRIAQSETNKNPKHTSDNERKKDVEEETKVVMREKKVTAETENERRQRLSVHMDEIMRGNMTAAIEIFDNLRKQEELQEILTKVEEIERDTSEVDVRSLRGIFENVPAWVVHTQEEKRKEATVEYRVDSAPLWKDDIESTSSMAHVFGDLERASEEIMSLKEQTLARLMDIEEAIKKALYSVSTLKSDSDIVGLSGLFRESLGTVQGSQSSGAIRKISIGSSKTKTPQAQESSDAQRNAALPVGQTPGLEVPPGKPQAGSPSSPAFICIQSAARKKDQTQALPPEATACCNCQPGPKTDENFRTMKTVLKCNSAAQNKNSDPRKGNGPDSPLSPKRELSVLEVQTDPVGDGIRSTKMVTENYERTDNFGNRFYSSKTSTVVSAPPETTTSSRGQVVTSPATYQVTTYPEVRLPVNKKP